MTDTRTIKGLDELSKKLVALGADLGAKTLRQSTRNAMTIIKREAKLRIPVGDRAHRTYKGRLVPPGFAKASIKAVSRRPRRGSAKARVSLGVKKEAFYATQFVELGTSKMQARPWLVPAMEAKRSAAEQKIASELKRKIDKYTR